MTRVSAEIPARVKAVQGEEMLGADEVAAMVRLHELGWGAKRLSKEFGCARNTVRRYLRGGGGLAFAKAPRKTAFDGLEEWLRERFFRHDGNADVIRQELASEHGIVIGLSSVELRVQRWRRELRAQRQATVRFEMRPGHQLQIDFGEAKVWIGEERIKIHLFVATLGYSRRMHIRASIRERQADWFEGMEGAFLRFGGVPTEILFDNARALVEHHDAVTREVRFNDRQQVGLARGKPGARGGTLALGAVPVAAAVISDPPMAAVFAGFDMTAQGGGAAMLDRRHDLELMQAQMPSMGGPINGAGGAEDIGDLERGAHRLSRRGAPGRRSRSPACPAD